MFNKKKACAFINRAHLNTPPKLISTLPSLVFRFEVTVLFDGGLAGFIDGFLFSMDETRTVEYIEG